jgi:glycosyltransferase involved in cell wall biosynthesis
MNIFLVYFWVLKYKIKIIQIEFFGCLFYSLFLLPLKLYNIKIFYTAHDIQTLYYPKSSIKYFLTRKIEKFFLKYFVDTIFVWGQDDKKELLIWKIKSSKIKVIPPIMTLNEKNKWKLNKGRNFVFMGSYSHKPNRDSLREILLIWPKIKKIFPCAKLYLIIGENKKIEFDDPSIINCGFVKDPIDVMSKCNLFLAPIFSGTGIKVKIIESFGLGVPLISTSLGFRNFDNLDSSVVPIADNKNFSKEVLTLVKEEIKLIKLSEYEKRYFSEKFSPKNVILYKKYYDL